MLELAAAGGVDTLVQNISLANPEEPLARQSWSCLSLMADTNLGRTTIIEQKAIALAIEELAMQDNSPTKHMYVYNVCRFLEVCSQHVNSAIQVVKNGGIHRLIKAIDRFYQQNAVPICLPCLGAIKWCFVFVPQDQRLEHVDSMKFNPLRAIYNKLLRNKELQAAQTEIYELLQIVLYLVDEEDLRTSPRRPTTAGVNEKKKRPSIKNERRKSQANVRAAIRKKDSISNLLDEVTQTLTDIPPAKPTPKEELSKSASLSSVETPPATASLKHSASVSTVPLSSKEAKKQREIEKEEEKRLAKELKDKKRRTSASPMPTITPADIKKMKRGSAEKPFKASLDLQTVQEEPAPNVSRAKALAEIKKSRRHTDRAVPRANLSRKTDITPGSLAPIPLLKPRAFDDQSKPRSLTNSSEGAMGDSLGPVMSTFPLPKPRNIVAEFINTPVTTVPSAMDARPEMKTPQYDSKQLLDDLMDEITNL
jgi:hypothetical protein